MQDSSFGPAQRVPYVGQVLLLACLYFGVAKLALLLAIPPGYATALWPPSGIALAAALLLGNRVWPGVWLGAALANLTVEASLPAAALIATGNTLEALAAATLIRRFVGAPFHLRSGENVVRFIAFAALSATIAATTAMLPLSFAHALPRPDVFWNWLTWWQGDAAGMIIVTPLILAWSDSDVLPWTRARAVETACFGVLLLLAAWVVFGVAETYRVPMALPFMIVPFVIWAAFRFGQREITAAIAVVYVIAIWHTVHDRGPFASLSPNESLLALLLFICVLTATGLVVGAVVAERSAAMERLRLSHAELESRVEERTRALEQANRALHLDIAERQRMEKLLVENLTQRMETERALRASEERFRLMVDSVTDYAIFMLDPQGRVASWNAGAQRINGYDADEILGQHYSRFFLREDVEAGKPARVLATAAAEGRYVDEAWRKRRDGSRFWAGTVVAPVKDETGRLIGFAKVTRDLSERKSAEIQMEDARAAAEKANQAKSEFLAKMSHELRTPLNSLLILARLLADNSSSNLTPKQVQYAETIYGAGMDLLALINDILDLAKIESGAVTEIAVAPVRFTEIQDYVESIFRQVAHGKGVQLTVTIDERLPAAIQTDGRRLQQILQNLLSNAFKFTRQGNVSLLMAPATSGWRRGCAPLDNAEEVVAFSVMDTGIGIPADKQELIFEAFQQAEGTTSRRYGGTGLGLSISREFTRLLSGDIRIDSNPGRGSTFTLYLPLALEQPASRESIASTPQDHPA